MNNRQKGFSLIELLVVVFIAGILAAVVFPSFKDWRQNMEYKEAARDIASMLRDARQRAISKNLEYKVVFEQANRQYRMREGDRAAGSTAWTTVRDWVTLPTGVDMTDNFTNVDVIFKPNGRSDIPLADVGTGADTLIIKDFNSGITKFTITVTPTGRVSISSRQ